jgi:uncharacterized protein
MAELIRQDSSVTIEDATLIEGLPGVGLVGKIAADHIVDKLSLTHYADVESEKIPPVTVYDPDDPSLHTPVRLYADMESENEIIVLQSDVPVTPPASIAIAECIESEFNQSSITSIYLSGIPRDDVTEIPSLYAVGTGQAKQKIDQLDLSPPEERGMISGPTGALLHRSLNQNKSAVGLIVESDPRFPDPEAARVLIKHGIESLLEREVPVSDLIDRAEQIRETKDRLAKRMQDANDESTQARPIGMYQ